MLTRQQMVDVINGGGSVPYNGQILTHISQLPGEGSHRPDRGREGRGCGQTEVRDRGPSGTARDDHPSDRTTLPLPEGSDPPRLR